MTDFKKLPKYQKLKIHRVGLEKFHAGWRTDEQSHYMTKLIVPFRMYLNTGVQEILNISKKKTTQFLMTFLIL